MHSVQCPGLVVSSSDVGAQLTLQIATGEDATLWNFLSNGLIESMKYPGFAIVVDGSNLKLSGPIQTAAPVIKRVGLNTTTGEYIQIFELEIFDPTGTNVARGKAATSSSVYHTPSIFPGGTAGPSNAVDGDLTNVFHTNSRHDGGDNSPWLNIDLGASVEARKIVIYNKWCGDVNDSAHPCLCRLSQANLVLYDGSNNIIKTLNVGGTCGKAILEYDLLNIPKWNKVNTRLLTTNEVSASEGWNQNWTIDFLEAFDGSILSGSDSGSDQRCYTLNEGFSPSFEDFARGLVINDESDEDQCRKARELLGFDRDYPYDTEVRDRFNDKACGIDYTTVDHMTKPLSKPPAFSEIEFEAPECVSSFEMWSIIWLC
jgi:hypothetical protein